MTANVIQLKTSSYNNSITKFKLFIRLVQLERVNDRERVARLNELICDLMMKERESGEYISRVSLSDKDLVELMFN